jgi:ribonucleoside-diphosphate reductase subunit M1
VTEAVSSLDALPFDEKTRAAAEAGPGFAAALERQRLRELEEAKMIRSIENKEACLMCSG